MWVKHVGETHSGGCLSACFAWFLGGGGGRGIRTLDTAQHRIHTFQACAFNRSATPPRRLAPVGSGLAKGEKVHEGFGRCNPSRKFGGLD